MMATNSSRDLTGNHSPSLRLIARGRKVFGMLLCGITTLALFKGISLMTASGGGCLNFAPIKGLLLIFFVAIPTFVMWLLSMRIASDLSFNPQRGISAALGFDIFLGALIFVWLLKQNIDLFVYGGDPMERIFYRGLAAVTGLWCLSEFAALQQAWRGFKGYAVLALGLFLLAVPLPILAQARHSLHVTALRDYILKNLIAMPTDTQIDVTRLWRQAGGDHTDHITFHGREYDWDFEAYHATGGWELRGLFPLDYKYFASRPTIGSAVEARAYLVKVGLAAFVPDETGEKVTMEASESSRLYSSERWATSYRFKSAISGCSYWVSKYGDIAINFSAPLIVPEQ